MNYETILESVYGDGLFQIVLTVCCSLTSFLYAVELTSLIFLHATPKFSCNSPVLDTFTSVNWVNKNVFGKLATGNYSTLPFNATNSPEQCWAAVRRSPDGFLKPFVCDSWHFNQEPMYRTLVTDYHLVCDYKGYITWMEAAVLLAMGLGYAMTMFTDRISRRKLFLFYCAWEIVTMVCVPFAPTLTTMFLIRIVRMFSGSLNYLAPCIIEELLPTKKRAIFGNLYWIPFGLGYMTSAGIAYFTRDWFIFRLCCLVPLIFYIPVFFIVPESPRWLTVNGRHNEFIVVIKRIAHWNRTNLPDKFYVDALNWLRTSHGEKTTDKDVQHELEDGGESCGGHKKKDSILQACLLPNMRLKCIVLFFEHSAVAVCYYGLSTNAKFTNDNIFLNVFFQGLTEIPSAVAAWGLSTCLGRRPSLIILLILTAISVVLVPVVKHYQVVASTVIAILGRMAVTSAFCISDLYVAEIFPTTVRNLGIYFIMTSGVIVSTVAPFINRLENSAYYLPGLLYGVLNMVGALLMFLCMPEMKRCPLPQTLEQAERLKRGKETEWILEMNQVAIASSAE